MPQLSSGIGTSVPPQDSTAVEELQVLMEQFAAMAPRLSPDRLATAVSRMTLLTESTRAWDDTGSPIQPTLLNFEEESDTAMPSTIPIKPVAVGSTGGALSTAVVLPAWQQADDHRKRQQAGSVCLSSSRPP